MKKVKKDHNPYPFDLKYLKEAEQDFVILVGHDFHATDDAIFYPLDAVDYIYEEILVSLRDILKHGTEEEKNDARWTLARTCIAPLRIH